MRNLHSRFLLSFIQAVQVCMPHPRGKQKMMYMQFGSDGFAATMNIRAGLKRRRIVERLGFKNLLLKRNNLSGFSVSAVQGNRGFGSLWSCQCFLFCSNTWSPFMFKDSTKVSVNISASEPFPLGRGPRTSWVLC